MKVRPPEALFRTLGGLGHKVEKLRGREAVVTTGLVGRSLGISTAVWTGDRVEDPTLQVLPPTRKCFFFWRSSRTAEAERLRLVAWESDA